MELIHPDPDDKQGYSTTTLLPPEISVTATGLLQDWNSNIVKVKLSSKLSLTFT